VLNKHPDSTGFILPEIKSQSGRFEYLPDL
jgi:hypothetical protein